MGGPVAMPRASSAVFPIRRSWTYGTISPVAVDAGGQLVAVLSQLLNLAEFTTLFQEFRITRAVFEFTFLPGSTGRVEPVLWVGNYVSSQFSAPTSLDEVLQLSGQKKLTFGPDRRTINVGFVPKIRTGDSVQQLRVSPWIAMASPNGAHFGLWYWISHFNTTYAPGSVMSITATYMVQFRGTQ